MLSVLLPSHIFRTVILASAHARYVSLKASEKIQGGKYWPGDDQIFKFLLIYPSH